MEMEADGGMGSGVISSLWHAPGFDFTYLISQKKNRHSQLATIWVALPPFLLSPKKGACT
jgi:hypothetical protein